MKKAKRISMLFGAWNIRTLMDRKESDRPERRTALIAKELSRYKIDIAALSETRWADEGQITEAGAGYTFFWSGRGTDERRESGVGFAIKSCLINKLSSAPKGINDRLMVLQLPLTRNKQATVISAYAPTMTNPVSVKDKFYQDLETLIATVPRTNKLILLGDFNARVGTDCVSWEGVIGQHGIGKCNSNGHLLLRTCAANDLWITNTMFRLPTRNKTTWMHPRSGHWHMIDYVIVRRKDRQDVRVTKAMCGAECWTDHRLLVTKMNFIIKPPIRPQGINVPKRLNVSKLRNTDIQQSLVRSMTDRLEEMDTNINDVEASWAAFKHVVYSTAVDTLGTNVRKHQDWFDENCDEIKLLLDNKHRLHRATTNDPRSAAKKTAFMDIRRNVQRRLRQIQDTWLSNKAEEIQKFADLKDMKNFYSALRAVYGPPTPDLAPLLSEDGCKIITEKDKILERWSEHFEKVLNRPSTVNEAAINRLPQIEINNSLDDPPTEAETKTAIELLSKGKAPGADSIPAEIYKKGGPTLISKLTEMFIQMWNQKRIPQDFKDASIIHLYKRKGSRQICDNHRGISLLCIGGKVLARILLNRLTSHLDQGLLPESQCGFRKQRGTTDMIFSARQLQEKCQEQNAHLYTTFVDLTKAFDTVNRDGLWRIMAKFGCPDTFIGIVKQFHEGMLARVLDQGNFSAPFGVTNGVKQGCVLAPTLFSLMFSAMLRDAFTDCDIGIGLRYRYDGNLLNLRRLQAKTKVKKETVCDLLYADDCALNTHTEADMQECLDRFSASCTNFGLTISTTKTEVLHQPVSKSDPVPETSFLINGHALKNVNRFTYLGSTLSRAIHIDDEVDVRIARASSAFGRLRTIVWNRRGIKLQTKIKVYSAIVLPTLLYACESWTVYSRHSRKLNHFHMNCLRQLLKLKWQDMVPDTEVLRSSGMISINTMLCKAQLRWAGHVARMPDHRLPKKLLYGELQAGKRSRGGQKKRYKDTLKASLKRFCIDSDDWENVASDRSAWRYKTGRGATNFEKERVLDAIQKRSLRKLNLNTASSSSLCQPGMHQCQQCNRLFRARIGLISHQRTHSKID